MKIKGFCLILSLVLVTSITAQVPDSLKKVQTLKPKTQTEILTEKAMKLKITTKKLSEVKEMAVPTMKAAGIPTDVNDVVAFVDGKEVPIETYKSINPANINSMTVLKNQEAIKKLTTKKCTSVILITTKKKATVK